jgi:ATP-dependent DNA helicase RecG
MSATPIPRTLALIMYGELDISVIDELPAGRQKIDTFLVGESMRTRVYNFIRKQVEMGFSAYVVCPAVEDDESRGLSSVEKLSKQIERDYLSGLRVGSLHGKMKSKDKSEIMSRFTSKELDVLVSTTVIEVGIDAPNATVIVIEDAQQFGLSQLHQLRGRVGRSSHKSYCIMICSTQNDSAQRRLKTLTKTHDGFEIAKADLENRGPGDFLGNRQHGLPVLKLASLSNMPMIVKSKELADLVIKRDPDLSSFRYLPIRGKIEKMFFEGEQKNIFN